jgi:hypothetical protein
MAGGKHAPEEKSKSFRKHTAIELEMKIRMTFKYELRETYLQLHVFLVSRYQL